MYLLWVLVILTLEINKHYCMAVQFFIVIFIKHDVLD